MLTKALTVPISDWKKYLIGSAMYLIPWLSIVTGLFAYGYVVEYVRRLLRTHNESLPAWSGFRTLAVDGILATIIGVVYMLPALIVGALILIGVSLTTTYDTRVIGFVTVVAILWLIAGWYVLPVAIIEYISRNSLRAALSPRRFAHVLKNKAYAKQWVLAVSVSIVLSLATFAIVTASANLMATLVPPWPTVSSIFGIVIAALVAFYQLICTFTLYTYGWIDSQEGVF